MVGDVLRDAFRNELAAIVAAALPAITRPVKDTLNTTENPDATSPGFIDIEFPGGSEQQFTFGAPAANLHREQGQVTIRVCTPLGVSVAIRNTAEVEAAQIRSAFRMRRFAAGARSIRITSTAPMGGGIIDAGLWCEAIALGYEIYNVG